MVGRTISSVHRKNVEDLCALDEEVALVKGLGEDVRDVFLGRDVRDTHRGVLDELQDLQVAVSPCVSCARWRCSRGTVRWRF